MEEKVKIMALRNFHYERVMYEPGAVLDVSRALSIELISLGKADVYFDEPKKEKTKGKGEFNAK